MKIAVLGYGTVGVGVYEMLKKAPGLEAGPVLVRPGKERAPFQTSESENIFSDPGIDAVAEAIGGVDAAAVFAEKALSSGKHYITANKALVAAKGPELAALARQFGVSFLFSAACGGGVPFLYNLSLAEQSDEILSVSGILNGSTNYILDAMQRRNMTYEEAFQEAGQRGYLEADPSADISGLDALRKILLACAVAYHRLPSERTEHEGIDHFTAEDVRYLQRKDLTCRLMASGGKIGETVYAYVEPTLLPTGHPGCDVQTSFNMASYEAKNAGTITLIGQGAGRYPTASAMLRDLCEASYGRRIMMPPDTVRQEADNSLVCHPYFVRLPQAFGTSLKSESAETYGGVTRLITAPVSVRTMHQKIEELRSKGADIFFAAMGE